MKYPKLGTKQSYIKITPENETIEGSGIVKAIFFDPSGREMAQVEDGENIHNVDLITLSASENTKKRYIDTMNEVRRLSEEGNKLAQEVVSKYNSLVEDEYNKLLGKPYAGKTQKRK